MSACNTFCLHKTTCKYINDRRSGLTSSTRWRCSRIHSCMHLLKQIFLYSLTFVFFVHSGIEPCPPCRMTFRTPSPTSKASSTMVLPVTGCEKERGDGNSGELYFWAGALARLRKRQCHLSQTRLKTRSTTCSASILRLLHANVTLALLSAKKETNTSKSQTFFAENAFTSHETSSSFSLSRLITSFRSGWIMHTYTYSVHVDRVARRAASPHARRLRKGRTLLRMPTRDHTCIVCQQTWTSSRSRCWWQTSSWVLKVKTMAQRIQASCTCSTSKDQEMHYKTCTWLFLRQVHFFIGERVAIRQKDNETCIPNRPKIKMEEGRWRDWPRAE